MTLLKSDFVYRNQGGALTVSAASGVSLTLEDGRRFIDLHAASGACVFGYRIDILQRVMVSLQRLPTKPQFCESYARVELAREMCWAIKDAGGCTGAVAFDMGGAQAIELALKIVSAARPLSSTVLVFEGAYHGRSLSLSHLSCSTRYIIGDANAQFRVVRLPVPGLKATVEGCSLADATQACLLQIETIFNDERFGLVGGSAGVHSFIFEPTLNVAGIIPIDPEYIRAIIRHVKRLGGRVIADEVFTGFHKETSFLATSKYLADVDVVVMSKGLTNGLVPLSVVWVNESSGLAESVKPGLHSSTYINNELAVVTALEVMAERKLMTDEEQRQPNVTLRSLFSNLMAAGAPATFFVHHNMGRISFSDRAAYERISRRLTSGAKYGVVAATTGLAPNTLIFHPAFDINREEFEIASTIMTEAFKAG